MTITARHALVTGSSRGIGRGIALKLAEHGVHVAINYLKDFDNPEEEIRPDIRLRLAKLNLLKGDYQQARQLFGSVSLQSKEPLKPAPSIPQQYEARYFRAVVDVLDNRIDDARKGLGELLAWKQANLPKDQLTQDRAGAAEAMLQYRIDTAQADRAFGRSLSRRLY